MEMPLTARNIVHVTSPIRAVYAPRLLTCSKHVRSLRKKSPWFASVKSSKKKGLPGILRLVMLLGSHDTSWVPIFTMRCSVAVKTV